MNIRVPFIPYFIIILVGMTFMAMGQIKEAKKEMSLFNYSKAIVTLRKAVNSKNPDIMREASFLMAECYRRQNDPGNAGIWYKKSLEISNPEPITMYNYAQALRSSGDYKEAKTMFLLYDSAVPTDQRGKIYASYCDSAFIWTGRIPRFEVQNISTVNTPESEFGAVFYHNGILFASDRVLKRQEEKTYGWTGNNYLRLFLAEPVSQGDPDGNFLPSEPFPRLDGQSWHNGPASFNKDNTEMFINRTLLDRDKGKKDSDLIRTHLLKIFTASFVDGKWLKPEPFFLNNNEYSVGHPALSPDGGTLFFVSDMAGGSGGTDIYFSIREAGKWSDPVNLGESVNTFGNEMFPYLAGNGDLYFASDGLPGFGGLDLFVTRKTDGKWINPENLGYPLNSSYDDFSLATADSCKTGFFSSNRPGGIGSDDIYFFTPSPPPSPPSPPPLPTPSFISGCVKDKTTMEPILSGTVFLLDIERGHVLILKTNEKGCFKAPIDKGKSYKVKATQTSYLPDCLSFNIDNLSKQNDLTIPRDLLLDKLEMNKRFTLENIFYDFDKWNIRPDAELSLNNLVRIMKENYVTIELGSHTDCRGSEEYNRILSQKRAESAVRYIVHQGIDPVRITAKGYGKSQLINRCNCTAGVECTETEHQANRRTEFRITGWSDQKINPPAKADSFNEGDIINVREFPDGFFGDCKFE